MAERMRRVVQEPFEGGAPLSDTLSGRSTSAPIADRQLERMNTYASNLQLPQPQVPYDPVAMMDSEYMLGMESYLDGAMPEFYDIAMMDPMMAEELFIPSAFDDSFFADDPEFQEAFGGDKEFEEFLKGKKKEYKAKEEKKKKWLEKKKEKLKEQGMNIRVNPDGSVTVTSTKYSAANIKPVIAGKAFKKFMEGKAPTYSGKGAKTAQWLAQNSARLARYGISVQVEGDRYLLTNTKFKKSPLNTSLFAGSGFGGPEFRSFVNGQSARFEATGKAYASWLLRNMNRLRAAGLDVHVDLNQQGNPTGRFVIQNPRMMSQLLGKGERRVILGVVALARKHYAIAKKMLKAARAIKQKGPDHFGKTKRYAHLALLNMDKARRLFSSAVRYYSLSRMLYAKRNELAKHPQRTLLEGLVARARKLLNTPQSAKNPYQELKKAQFLMALVNTTLFARKIGNSLSKSAHREIGSHLSSALHLFELGKPGSLEKAGLMLSSIKSFVSLSVQHATARLSFRNLKNIKYMANVEHMPIFHTNERFDARKFKRLTGISYDEYRKGTPRTKAGVATVLGSMYLKSMQHYERSIKAYRSALNSMSKDRPVDAQLSKGLLLAQKEHALGAIEHSRVSQLQPLYLAAAKLYEAVRSVPLKDDAMKKGLEGLGPKGMKEITDARNKAWERYRTALAYVSRGMFGLLAAQNTEGQERKAMLKSTKTNLDIAGAQNQKMLRAINNYHDLHSRTKHVISYLRRLAKAGVDETVFGQSTILALRDHLAKLRKPFTMTTLQKAMHAYLNKGSMSASEKLLRHVFLKTITNPYLLESMPLPRKKEILAHMDRLGRSFFQTLHEDGAKASDIRAEVKKMLARKITIRRAHIGNETGSTKQLATFSYDKVTLRAHLKDRFPDIYKKLIKLEKNPNSMTTDQRRELLLTILKLPKDFSASEAMKRVVKSLHASIEKNFAAYFTAYIKMLDKRAAAMPKLGKDIGIDANYLLENLRPTQISIMSTHTGTQFSLLDTKHDSALSRLKRNAAEASSVGEQMKQVLPNIMLSFYKGSAAIAEKVGKAEVWNQIKIDRAREERKAIAIVTVAAALIAAPFTGGMSVAAGIGFVSFGIGFGVTAVSLPLSIDNYKFVNNHPMATDADIKAAKKRLIYDSISAAAMVTSIGGTAFRAWAIGRGSLRLAQISLAAEAASAGWGVYLGTKGVYSGIQAFRSGNYGAGLMSITTGGMSILGGSMTAYSKLSAIRALRNLGVTGKTPAQLAKNLNQKLTQSMKDIDDGMRILKAASSGQNVIMNPKMAEKFAEAVRFVSGYTKIGGRIPPNLQKSFMDFNNRMFVQPAEDVRAIGNLVSQQKGNVLITPKQLSSALDARTRLLQLSQFRTLSKAEQGSLERLNKTLGAIASRDTAIISAKFPANPNPAQILTRASAQQRLLRMHDAGVSTKASSQVAQSRVLLHLKISKPISLRGLGDRLLSPRASTRVGAEAELAMLTPQVRGIVKGYVKAVRANPANAKTLAAQYSAKIGELNTASLKQTLSVLSDFVSSASKPGMKLSVTSGNRVLVAGQAMRDHLRGGGRLTPEQRKVYDSFRKITISEPARNISMLKQVTSTLTSPGEVIRAAAIRARIETMRTALPLSSEQAAVLKAFDAAAAKRASQDYLLLVQFSSKPSNVEVPLQELKGIIEARQRLGALESLPSVDKKLGAISSLEAKLKKVAEHEAGILERYVSSDTAQRLKMADRVSLARKKLAAVKSILKLSPEQEKSIKKYDEFSA